METARAHLTDIDYAPEPYACAEGADALVILTEWDAFRALDVARLRAVLRRPVVVDLRNIYRPHEMERHGFHCTSIGQGGW